MPLPEFVPPEDIHWALGLVPGQDLFQTLLVFENYPREKENQIRQRHQMPLTEGRAWRRDVSEVDLTCYVDILDDHLQIRGCYLEGVVDEREVERIIMLFARKLVDGVTQGVI